MVSLKLKDIGHPDRIAARATVMRQKTKRPVQFEITDGTRQALLEWTAAKGLKYDDYLFPSRGIRTLISVGASTEASWTVGSPR